MTAESLCCMYINSFFVEDEVTDDELGKPFLPREERDFAIMGLMAVDGREGPCSSHKSKGETCKGLVFFRLHFGDGANYIEGNGCGDLKNYFFPGLWGGRV